MKAREIYIVSINNIAQLAHDSPGEAIRDADHIVGSQFPKIKFTSCCFDRVGLQRPHKAGHRRVIYRLSGVKAKTKVVVEVAHWVIWEE